MLVSINKALCQKLVDSLLMFTTEEDSEVWSSNLVRVELEAGAPCSYSLQVVAAQE